ncbi:NAD(P)/FAD-dependent oxidoreductase [Geminocystis sp. GBBB08]|uniref:NAD(P)/FAD-dependent oxidoreductase n=1 Tax=Geminocystis sp. GBBB08 TaxID=2604140 RepID=UPI0027E25EB3|nr:NAD(P)/FAD-dependent oxidoreductase [Geminocystis sp. GBBB08]MBL1210149.1 NAD(P)/FAD-dependent oxidoreductase [Geminocystis sp. GBBB08]
MKKIVIVGGGFGGLYTALRLIQLDWRRKPEITIIDKNDRFVFSPLLYELITEEMRSWEIAPHYADLLATTPIKYIQDTVTNINIEQKEVILANHDSLAYDRLVIALGGTTPTDLVKGAREYGIPFRTLENAYQLKEKLRQLENSEKESIKVAIVGGGYSGVELALKIANRLGNRGKIRIIDRNSDIISNSPEFNQKTAKKALRDHQIWLDLETDIEEIKAEEITLSYKNKSDTIPVDIVLWTIGTKPVRMINELSLPQNAQGKININRQLQVENHPEIFALGDLVECYDQNNKTLPATAQVAFQQADYCAWNIWASLEKKPLLTFQYQPLGEMLALGVGNATLSGLGISLNGELAYLARRLVYLYRLPTFEHQLGVALNWITSPITTFK